MLMRTYFLGGSSARGFQTKFGDIIHTPGYYTYILKGGPGTGKSTLIKKIAKQFEDRNVELYYCSSDIKSLDAVVVNDLGVVIVDGTAPHVFNADYPGVSQCLVDLGDYWDKTKLQGNEAGIRSCFKENAAYHRRARSYINALSSVNSGMYDLAAADVNHAGIRQYAKDLTADIRSVTESGQRGYKQLAAITSEGYRTQPVPADCHVIGIRDDSYVAGSLMMEEMTRLLAAQNTECVVSECVLFDHPLIEHIMLPAQKLQFSLITPLNRLETQAEVDCAELYQNHPQAEEFARAQKIARVLEEEAAYSIRRALEVHDDLEHYYITALNFDGLNRKTTQMIWEIGQRA